ncbi:MAG: glycosyltransferase family 39 protein [Chloroflexi bacterium]|nr:glycosyltransferase family 39 protein [Chloroflexota bacterium]
MATVLRFWKISSQSLWYDEGVSAGMVGHGLLTIIKWSAADFHPPLYYLLLAGWARLFGSSEVSLRGLSAVAGSVLVVATLGIGQQLFSKRVAWVAAGWLAAAPLAVTFSQEVRMYMPVAATVAVAAVCALRWLFGPTAAIAHQRSGHRRLLVAYTLCAVGAMYLQYVAAIGLLPIGLVGLLWARGRALWEWLVANAVALLLFAPWIPVLHYQLTVGRTATTAHTSAAAVFRDSLGSLLVGIDGLPLLSRAAVVILLLVSVLGAIRCLSTGRRGALPLLLLAVTIATVTLYAAWKHVFEVRYTLVALPGVALLIGTGVDLLAIAGTLLIPKFLRPTVQIGVTAGCTVLLSAFNLEADLRYYYAPLHPNDNYRGLVHVIVSKGDPGDAVVLYAPGQNHVFDYYYHGSDPVIGLPLDRPPDVQRVDERLSRLAAHHPRIWLVEYGQQEADPHGVVLQWFARHAFLASHQWFGSVQLELFHVDSAPRAPGTVVRDHFRDGITLENYSLSSRSLRPGSTLGITLRWETAQPVRTSYTVFTHVLNSAQDVVAQHDGLPASGTRPTTTWIPGQVVIDLHGIVLPPTLPPGTYTVEVGLYVAATGQRDIIVGGADHPGANRILLGSIVVTGQ